MTDPTPNRPEEAHSIAALAPGRTVGAERYLLKKVLGQGGMGVVWLAAWVAMLLDSKNTTTPAAIAATRPIIMKSIPRRFERFT